MTKPRTRARIKWRWKKPKQTPIGEKQFGEDYARNSALLLGGLKWIDKPDSVVALRICYSDHSSCPLITQGIQRPYPGTMGGQPSPPIWPCSRWGLPCVRHHWQTGELLPRHFNLAGRRSGRRYDFCGTFPRSLGAVVSGHLVLWSPDFPRFARGRDTRSLDPL